MAKERCFTNPSLRNQVLSGPKDISWNQKPAWERLDLCFALWSIIHNQNLQRYTAVFSYYDLFYKSSPACTNIAIPVDYSARQRKARTACQNVPVLYTVSTVTDSDLAFLILSVEDSLLTTGNPLNFVKIRSGEAVMAKWTTKSKSFESC